MLDHRKSLALAPQSMDVPLYVGQDSSIDPRILAPGSLAVVENGRLSYRGQVRKRFGFTAQPTGGITSGAQVMSGGSALLQHDGANINSYSQSMQQWTKLGRACGGQVTNLGTVQTTTSVQQCSSAATAALQVIVWSEVVPGPLYYCILDLQTGVQVIPRATLATLGQAPNVLQLGGNFYIFWGDLGTSQAKIMMRVIPGTNPTALGPAIQLPGTPSANTQYDVCVNSLGTGFMYATEDTGQGSSPTNVIISALNLTTAGIGTFLGTFTTGAAAGATTQPSCFPVPTDGSAGGVYGGLAARTTLIVYNTAGGVYNTAIPLIHKATAAGNTLFLEYTPYGCIQPCTITFNGSAYLVNANTPTPLVAQNGLHLITRAFSSAYSNYVWAVVDAGFQSLDVLIDSQGAIVGIAGANGAAGGYDGSGNALSHCTNDGAGNFAFVARTIRTVQATGSGPIITSIGLASKNLALGTPHTYPFQLDNVTYMGNCAPQIFDGAAQTEWGFYFYPEASVQGTAPGAGSLNGGTYFISACYAWSDATGKVWRSPTSFTQTGGTPSTGALVVTLPYLWLTTKTNVNIEVYCSANVAGQTGSALYLAAVVPNQPPVFSGSQPIGNGIFNTTITLSDTAIAAGLSLYTNGGVPDNLTPPPLVHLSSSGLRLYGCCGEDNNVYVTTPATPGQPLEFPLAQSVAVESVRGGLVGAQPQDGQLWIATNRAWFLTNADVSSLGTGQGNIVSFAPPARAAFGDGCVSGPSILPSSMGIYYQSSRGLELITRQQQPQFVGEPVKNVLGTVIDAYVVPSQQQIRFVYPSIVLCYDYERHTWLQHVFQSAPTLVSACQWNGLGVLGTADGQIRLENTASFFDDVNIPIIMRVQTPWLRLGGLAGWGKLWDFIVLGEQETPCTVQVQLAYNDDPTWIDTLTIPATTLGKAFGASPPSPPFGQQSGTPPAPFGQNPAGNAYKWLGIVPRADGNSFKFEFQTLGSTGEDVRLNLLTLLYGLQPGGLAQFPAGRKFG